MRVQNGERVSPVAWVLVMFVALLGALVSTCGSVVPRDDHWPDCETGSGNINNSTAVVLPDSAALMFENGDLVGVFTEAGKCVGQALYSRNQNFAITVWGDDDLTAEVDGAVIGERLQVRLLGERVMEVVSDVDMVYAADGVYVLQGLRWPDVGWQDEVDQREAIIVALNEEIGAWQDSLLAARGYAEVLVAQGAQVMAERDQLAAVIDSVRSIVN